MMKNEMLKKDYKTMKREDIDRMFTETVAEFIAKGYHINTATMTPYMERKFIDLASDNDAYRVMLEERNPVVCFRGLPALVIRVAKINVHHELLTKNAFVFEDELHTVSQTVFFQIPNSKGEERYVNEKDGNAARDKHIRRVHANAFRPRQLSDKYFPIALKWLQRTQKGFEDAVIGDVEKVYVRGDNKYVVCTKGHKFAMH